MGHAPASVFHESEWELTTDAPPTPSGEMFALPRSKAQVFQEAVQPSFETSTDQIPAQILDAKDFVGFGDRLGTTHSERSFSSVEHFDTHGTDATYAPPRMASDSAAGKKQQGRKGILKRLSSFFVKI
ncbi:hypothetical protein HK104_006597 [Borealophlyctis nickersoniae]|nr:hypothetical protein HK104_006597 [Borealophlyctis nickersoniae]